MVIDDSKTIRRTAETLLKKEGCEVITATDGFEALAKIADTHPDIIFVDIMMPRLDGYQTCALIKHNQVFRETPVIMLSSKDGLFDRARGAGIAGSNPDDAAGKQVLAEGLVALNGHIGALHGGDTAPTSRYMDDINKLRAMGGASAMSDVDEFVRRLRDGEPYALPEAAEHKGADLKAIAGKVKDPARKVFAALDRDGNTGPAIDALYRLSTTLERAARALPDRQAWWVARVLLERVRGGTVADTQALRALLHELEGCIAKLAEGNDPAYGDWSYRALYLLHGDSGEADATLSALFSAFRLAPAGVPDGPDVEPSNLGDARAALAKAAQDELARVRDAYDVYLRSGASDAELLKPAARRLQGIIAPLGVAGLDSAADLLSDAYIALAALGEGQPLGAAANMIADTLLHAEEVLSAGAGGPADKMWREAVAALVDGALELLGRVHQALLEAIDVGEAEDLAGSPAALLQLAGSLKVAGMDDAAGLARQASDAVHSASRGGAAMDALAEALVCLELYLGTCRENPEGDRSLLVRAQETLAAAKSDTAQDAGLDAPAEHPIVSGSADPDLLAIYIEEAGENLESVRAPYLELRAAPADADLRVSLQRFFHTLKGSGRMVGAVRMAEFSWAFEELLTRLNEDPAPLTGPVLDLLGAAIIVLSGLREQLESGADQPYDLTALTRAAADPASVPAGTTKAVLSAEVDRAAGTVRRWLDAVAAGKGSGRVPPAVPAAVTQVVQAAELLGGNAVAAPARTLLERLDATFEVEPGQVPEWTAAVDALTASATDSGDADIVDAAAADSYREEARALLDRMGESLDALLMDAGDTDAVVGLQRGLHTLKGTSRVAGFRALSDLTHELEAVLQAVAQEQMVVTPRLLWMLQRVLDAMFGMLDAEGEEIAADRGRATIKELRQLSGDDRSLPPLPPGADRRRKPRVSIESERVRSDQFDRALVRALSFGLRSAQLDARMHEQTMWNVATLSEMMQELASDARAIREALVRARQAPVHLHATRWRRTVRQAAEDNGREVELRFEGSDTELDRRLLDGLVAPLEHLLRNAVAHGIETPFARRAADKPPGGTIVIRTEVETDGVVLEIEDDGAGVDEEKVRRAARERGLSVPDGALSDEMLLGVLATPGFSTASQVTQSSGYGIGLDSVLAAIRELGGSVRMASTRGKGTRFALHLPNPSPVLTVEVYQVGNAIIAIPPTAVVTARSVDPAHAFVEHDGEQWPYMDLAAAIGVIGARPSDESQLAVLLRSGQSGAALRVDTAMGRVETAVHRLSVGELSDGQCVAGVGLLDGGKLATVLHVDEALKRFADALHIRPFALVADDSSTARDEVVRKLTQAGWRVLAVEDGATAKKKLMRERPQLVVLDIDMPGLNGLEVLEWMRGQETHAATPVVMVSADFDDDRHRRAAALHVVACVDKPFRGSEFEDVLSGVDHSA
jgi:chemotaxis protein histidine kinase CheA/DNA-binding response OmpR family regulator